MKKFIITIISLIISTSIFACPPDKMSEIIRKELPKEIGKDGGILEDLKLAAGSHNYDILDTGKNVSEIMGLVTIKSDGVSSQFVMAFWFEPETCEFLDFTAGIL